MLCGGDSMLHLERLRADQAGAELRAVAEMPAASTACRLARRYRRSHPRAAEQAFAACANAMDAQLGREAEDAVTLGDLCVGELVGPRRDTDAPVTRRRSASAPGGLRAAASATVERSALRGRAAR